MLKVDGKTAKQYAYEMGCRHLQNQNQRFACERSSQVQAGMRDAGTLI